MIYKAELFGNEKYGLGEGPCYDPGSGRLSWVDITAGKLWQMNASGERTSFDLGQQIGAAVPVKGSDGFVLCATDGLYLYESGKAELVLNLKGLFKPYLRCNDAKLILQEGCGSDPRFRMIILPRAVCTCWKKAGP